MKLLNVLWFACLAAALAAPVFAQSGFITIDEDFSDWEGIAPVFERSGDEGAFQRVWVTNDDRYLFISIEMDASIILQESSIVLYIDTDADAATGHPVHGLGAEIEWHFGDKVGRLSIGGQSFEIEHPVLGLVSAPTVSSDRFEIALRRDAAHGATQIFSEDEIRIVLVGEASGDVAPSDGEVISYTFADVERERPPVSLARPEDTHLRVVSYNVLRDGPFFARDAYFGRVLHAIAPDVIAFQEMYSTSADFVANWLARDVPLEGDAQWYVARAANDVMLASRFPITDVQSVQHSDRFAPRTGAFTVNLRPDVQSDLLIYVTHTACCRNDAARQEQLDALMAHLRDRQPNIPQGTPFMIVGDFNLVTYESQRRTVLYGEISDTDRFGPAFAPDWDYTPLADLKPLVTGLPMSFTWYDEGSEFSPGRLDYIFYSNYSMSALNGFVLFSRALLDAELSAYGLEAYDTSFASDHLPVVGDFRFRRTFSQSDFSLNGPVTALVADGEGGFFVGGSFTASSAGALDRLGRWEGSGWHDLGSGLDGDVRALTVSSAGVLYAGGPFSLSGSTESFAVAQHDGEGWTPVGSDLRGQVNALAAGAGGSVYVGGWVGNDAARHLAVWNGEEWLPVGGEPIGEVMALAVDPAGHLYIGGTLTAIGGVTTRGIARWNGSSWQSLGSGLFGTVRAIALGADGSVFAGGEFALASGSTERHHVARWDGTAWEPLVRFEDPEAMVHALAIGPGDVLIAGGQFRDNDRGNGLSVWSDGAWQPVDLDILGGTVHALLVQPDGSLIVGGDFSYGGEVSGRNIAYLETLGVGTIADPVPHSAHPIEIVALYPNPAALSVTASIRALAAGDASVTVYNVLGQEVRTLPLGLHGDGVTEVVIDTSRLAGGLYLVQVTAGGHTATRKLLVVR
jgi:endonuclease/exonuclease/phosphatase family metal-dependent hydrolase